MDALMIHTLIQSRYSIFDACGELPFSIIFGLCRNSTDDIDPRALVVDISGSALDVPYALANELLKSHGINTLRSDKQRLKDANISTSPSGTRFVTLPSPMGRTKHYKECFTIFEYRIDVDSELASLLQPGKKYSIKLASRDLGIKWWTYVDEPQLPLSEEQISQSSEPAKLLNSKPSAGHAAFTVVDSLPWPPEVTTRMCIIPATETTAELLEISMTNAGPLPLSIQVQGRQRFLEPQGLFGRESPPRTPSHRPLETETPVLYFGFLVTNTATDEIVLGDGKRRTGCIGLTSGKVDPRPRMQDLITLEPVQPLVRHVDLGGIVVGLKDGTYRIELREKAMWWCEGRKEDICDEEDGRVKKELFRKDIPPVVLRSEDTFELRVVDEEMVRSGSTSAFQYKSTHGSSKTSLSVEAPASNA
ncbi:hypothetical protein D6D12_02278 [Aureobasidium pullulans]|uniref:Uncharacterized protein n=1 Tax=Aureobasidium pullulans TaxID=5580 RepID=A0AB74K1A0_AURPU|nr:hypothetical protein D6D12_02278 [Aureobasidium pullulans]THX63939.1 hypothetical protein D6D11_01484 [Aureobasidium pullulans]